MSNQCVVEMCERDAVNRKRPGMCALHKCRKTRGMDLHAPVRAKGRRPAEEVIARDPAGNKLCLKCGEWRPESKFEESRYTPDQLKSRCRSCTSEATRLRQKGMTESSYEALLEAQQFRCAICGAHESTFSGKINIDHDHSCCSGKVSCGACVRGLLCPWCNMGIGALRDDPKIVRSALAYLESFT